MMKPVARPFRAPQLNPHPVLSQECLRAQRQLAALVHDCYRYYYYHHHYAIILQLGGEREGARVEHHWES